jgi:hypothetical protein
MGVRYCECREPEETSEPLRGGHPRRPMSQTRGTDTAPTRGFLATARSVVRSALARTMGGRIAATGGPRARGRGSAEARPPPA